MSLKIAVAETEAEREACYRLRYDVNINAGKQGSFLCHHSRRVVDELDEIATIYYAAEDDRIIATMRTVFGRDAVPDRYRDWFQTDLLHDIPRNELSFTSRLVICESHRNSMALRLLLGANYYTGRRNGALIDLMHCAPALIPMYEKMGYQCYARGIAHTDVGSHVPMLLLSDDAVRLKRLGSPFGFWAEEFPVSDARTAWFTRRFPEFAGGMSTSLSAVDGFIARIKAALAADTGVGPTASPADVAASRIGRELAAGLASGERPFKRATRLLCRRGDIAANSDEAFADPLIQISGSSTLVANATSHRLNMTAHSGTTVIDQFVDRPKNEHLLLRCTADSEFLVIPGKELARRKPQPAADGEESARAA